MTISLDAIVLDDSLIWEDRHEAQKVAQAVRRTLGGSPVVFTGALGAGFPITLVATANFGWFTKAQVDALQLIADVAGGVYSLVYGALTASVMFRHQDAPAVAFTPLLARQTQLSTDYFTGTIKLMTV